MTQVLAALVSGVVALAVSLLGFKLQESRLRAELRTEFMAEEAIRRLLENKDFELRSFSVIEHHVGGFEDNELRRLLVRSGALRFRGSQGEELWGLRQKNLHRLERPE